MKKILSKSMELVGLILSYIFILGVSEKVASLRNRIYTGYHKRRFAHFGDSVLMWHHHTLIGEQYIHIGDNTIIESGFQLTARKIDDINPVLKIGDNCLIRKDTHITAVNSVKIGNDLLTGTNVLITDNLHGKTDVSSLCESPRVRKPYSKGGIVIGNGVWLGNNVCVMPGVTIGDSVVVGANSVVTHDIPSFSIVAGIPARIIKQTIS